MEAFSIILPAKNEALALGTLLTDLLRNYPNAEIIVVNDGSTDNTAEVCRIPGVTLIDHPYSMGNGAAIKTGARNAKHDIIVFLDADGQHDPSAIPRLLEKMHDGYEMVVGARDSANHASSLRRLANWSFNRLASLMTGYPIEDLTSGFRAVRARYFRKFLYLLPNGFSYPTTSTMAYFRSGLPVAYVPIHASKRLGSSHIKIIRDGLRFFIIILKIGALFSPMGLFLPIALMLFAVGVSFYGYTYLTVGRFTNMSAVLLLSSLSVFLMGIISEQISSLHYKGVEETRRRSKR